MARPGRLHVPHATYFVVNRFRTGIETLAASPTRPHSREERDQIEVNRRRFEALLNYLRRRWCARVHAYCWLPDSALLLLKIGAAPLESIMHTLRGQFSHHLREKDSRSGPAYAGRYFVLMIDPDDYLLDFARHIFWSPVHAGLCRNPLGYEHGSARACAGDPDPASLCDSTLLHALTLRGQQSRLGFSRFLTGAPTPGFLRLLAHGSRLDRRIAGSSTFVREAHRSAARRPPAPAPATIISWVASRLSLDSAEIVGLPRRAHSVEGRALVAWLATCAGTATLAQVARWFGCVPSTLHRAVDHYSAVRPERFNEQVLVEFTSALVPTDIKHVAAERDLDAATDGED
ncbi:MAG: hypothetical protein WBE92_07490 [Steroidobacteraceae bacterium]